MRHLRGLRIDVHRPFTLRLFDDASKPLETGAQEKELIKVLEAVSSWLTRLWLSGKKLSGLNTQFANFAHYRDPENAETYADYWIDEIRGLRKTSIAVPNEKEVTEGIKKRKAYGGKASDAARTILWTINSFLGNPALPMMTHLSLEHIMPRTLSKQWKQYLGDDFEEMEEIYLNTLPNLTLVGTKYNSEISNQMYDKKRELYLKSTVFLTRELAKSYAEWTRKEIDDYSLKLADWALRCWPWENVSRYPYRWKISEKKWNYEKSSVDILLNVVASILDQDPAPNTQKLLGNRITKDLQPIDKIPSDKGRFRSIPRYDNYKICVDMTSQTIFKLCREIAYKCGEDIVINIYRDYTAGQEIWDDAE